jgi:transposase
MITAWHRSNETSKRLDAIPGVGHVLATALVASIADPKVFRSGGAARPRLQSDARDEHRGHSAAYGRDQGIVRPEKTNASRHLDEVLKPLPKCVFTRPRPKADISFSDPKTKAGWTVGGRN